MASSHLRLVCLLAALALGGCAQWRHYELGEPIRADEVPRAEHGWTLAQVMAKYGPPLRMSREAGGYVMAWEYWEVDEYKFGFGLGFAGADFLNVDWGSASAEGDFLLMTFSHDHLLLTTSFEEWDRDAGGGQGVQAFVSAVDVVEVGDLLDELSQHTWGAQSLRRTPVTLNQQNRLDNGEAGLEQRGGTSVLGQHSLQMGR